MFYKRKVVFLFFLVLVLSILAYKKDAVFAYIDYFTFHNDDFHLCSFRGGDKKNKGELYKEDFIAHGQSRLFGYPSNTLESLGIAVKYGYKFIEIDMQVTNDNVIVAAHDWENFYKETGRSERGGDVKPLSVAEFKKIKVKEVYTPLTIDEINDVFISNPEIYLVTDKITDYKLIVDSIPYQDRLIVEVFSVEQYKEAISFGIQNPMLTIASGPIYRIKNSFLPDTVKRMFISFMPSAFKMADSMNINMYAVDLLTLESSIKEAEKLIEKGACVFAYTSNNKKYMSEHLNKSVTKFYTDYWNPLVEDIVTP